MPLNISSEVKGSAAHITLAGELDSSTAGAVRKAVEEVLVGSPASLLLFVEQLNFMASAGLRVLIFAKQRSPDLKVYVVKPQEAILDTLRKTGFYQSVYVVDAVPT